AASGSTAPASLDSTGGAAVSTRASAASGPPKAADWQALARDLSGPLIRPGESGYTTAKELFDPRFDSLRPAGIAYCRNPHHVATSLAFVRRYGIPVAARCGGHSYAGWSSTSGLVVDGTRMAGGNVSGSTATAGAGTRPVDFYKRVAADGQIRTANAKTNPDLFWACRGGGGGNFGVVTSFTFTTHPAGAICLFFLSWPWSQAARVVAGWQSWAPHAPDQLWSNLHLAAAPGGSVPSIQVGGTYLGS